MVATGLLDQFRYIADKQSGLNEVFEPEGVV